MIYTLHQILFRWSHREKSDGLDM